MSATSFDPRRRRFVRTAAGGAIVAALPLSGCATFASKIPDAANAAWSPDAVSDDPRVRALSWAILAPNPHNRQPWLIELVGEDEIVVRIDTTRLLPETDPFGRQILIGTGAMLGLLDIAAAKNGLATRTHWFESGDFGAHIDDRPVARVRLMRAEPSPELSSRAALFEHIPARRTVRDGYDAGRMPDSGFDADLASLIGIGAPSVRTIRRRDDPELAARVAALTKRAWEIEIRNPEAFMESVRLLRVGSREIEHHRDGISITSPFLVAIERLGLFDRSAPPEPDSSILARQIDDFAATVDATPAFLVMTSADNERTTQLQVGKAYVRTHLLATARGMVMHPLSQALQEYAAMGEAYRDAHRLLLPEEAGTGATVQMLCRVGHLPAGTGAPVASPRRGLAEHLVA